MKNLFEADSIQLAFGLKTILSDVYIQCETGNITGVLGRNGQGKTCLMNIIYGSLETTSKSVRFNKVSIVQPFKRPDLITYLPQFNFIPGNFSIQRIFSDFELDFSEFINLFPEFKTKYKAGINSLSGGQRRLVEVYTIIKSNAQFSMLDEPFTHLSPVQIEKVMALLQTEKANKGFIITDHMYRYVADLSNYIYVIANGKTHLVKAHSDFEKYGYIKG